MPTLNQKKYLQGVLMSSFELLKLLLLFKIDVVLLSLPEPPTPLPLP
jgi:hypothetical protein